jgi:hypothetical protein
MSATIYDLSGYRQARAYRVAAERELDADYAALLDGLAATYERKALGGGLQSSAGPLPTADTVGCG